ncbi:protein serine/threonine kinase, putative [Entamoeba invadens IP1]|uniref:Protein serine/threonine kinase, putative n=1 Tax=Entamoeba invadens IP1 TaxID=370355 RepID=A0A0A1UFE3_ENTIV|nr:protein serine/threonine kinase, putative [Entamoeba invadens IP1]ELP95310.1 protein serine/threonine kinase, putative [Entamoeba invadens IP1]|eukprot:XP_004262081.1 protein serine/threonine kinase, putative [Entamoeba invadens IP1]
MKRFCWFEYILFFVTCVYSLENTCECVPKNTQELYGFVSLYNTSCTPSENVYCFNNSFTFNGSNIYNTIAVNGTLTFFNTIMIFTNTIHFALNENSTVNFKSSFHVNNFTILYKNSTAKINRPFSIAGNISIEYPKIDSPPLVLWDSYYLHLNYNYHGRPNFSIINPTGNCDCFDVISMSTASSLNIDSLPNHIRSNDFPFSMNDGKALLISNKKLIRFCPTNTLSNNRVKCVLKENVYVQNYLQGSPMYGFEYPHCPCDDSLTDCHLYLADNFMQFDFNNTEMYYTNLHVEKNTIITNAKIIRTVIMSDNVVLYFNGNYSQSKLSFTVGDVVVLDNNCMQSTFQYNSTNNELLYTNINISDIVLIDEISYIKINGSGIINNIIMSTDKVIYITKEVKEVKNITNFYTSNKLTTVVMIIESENTLIRFLTNCVLIKTTATTMECLKCNSKRRLRNQKCVEIDPNCQIYDANNECSLCKTGYVLSQYLACLISTNSCLIGTSEMCYKCDSNTVALNGICLSVTECEYSDGKSCLKCNKGDYSTMCKSCESNCELCESGKCTLCMQNYLLTKDNKCEINNISYSQGNHIISCIDGYYIDNSICKKCSFKNENSTKCNKKYELKCETNYRLSDDGNCETTICDENEVKDENGNCSSIVESCLKIKNEICVECEESYFLNMDGECVSTKDEEIKNCKVMNNRGCLTCDIGYYTDSQICFNCNENCTSCITTSSQCISCKDGFYLGENKKCISNKELFVKCEKLSTVSSGCYQCKNGYYRSGLDCIECLSNCSTCNTKSKCLTCNSTNYKTQDGNCLPQSSLIGCQVEVTQNGCSKCQGGYYLINTNECAECDLTCKTCSVLNKCISCSNKNILNNNGQCIAMNKVDRCVEVANSKCSKCSFWYVPSESGTFCNTKAVWWVIILIVLFLLIIIVMCIVSIVFIFNSIQRTIHKKEIQKSTTVFTMSKSNIQFISIGDGVVVNKTEIIFGNGEEVDVNEKQRELLCVGNTTQHNMKIQISTKTNQSDKIEFTSNPQIVFLRKGEACEFEIEVTVLCTLKFQSSFLLVANLFEKEKAICKEIGISAVSKLSTRLDSDELIEEKKIGEGSFGVVYKGTFRGNVVVIKKMKSSEENSLDEFNKEVSMLDKFRCEYIVHFYGAVFVPNKMCIVTEFAQFGSFFDVMNNKNSNEVDMKIRIKMMIDASKGILYLHSNGILHRDIKPDNILVFSFDLNETVNAKLTDFGSSRNINMMLTNMTFTKGIGTPTYMAPEILKKEKYKKSADIFSLGVTMFECFSWKEAYPKEDFKYPWKIAEFVMSGKRLVNSHHIPNNIFAIITSCWCQNSIDRITSEEVVLKLEKVV